MLAEKQNASLVVFVRLPGRQSTFPRISLNTLHPVRRGKRKIKSVCEIITAQCSACKMEDS